MLRFKLERVRAGTASSLAAIGGNKKAEPRRARLLNSHTLARVANYRT
jgi:hypothetical protein